MLQIRKGKSDNLGIIFHSTPLKRMLQPIRDGSMLQSIVSPRQFYVAKKSLFEILRNILKLILAIIFGVRIFRVFEVLGKLPYIFFIFPRVCLSN